MISIEVQGEQSVIAHLRDRPEGITKAMVRALNRGISSARTVMVREIARDTGLKSGDVRASIPLREASFNKPEASIAASLKRIPLISFGRARAHRIRGAFIATVGRGRHEGIFVRVNPTRSRVGKRRGSPALPIKELFGPSLGHVFKKYRPMGVARAIEAFNTNFSHELEFQRSRDAGTD